MSAYINKTVNYTTTGAQTAIPLNRWGSDNYTISAVFTGAGDVSFEGTVTQLNRVPKFGEAPPVPDWFAITPSQITADGAITITDYPLEAIRANIATNGGNIKITILQQGQLE